MFQQSQTILIGTTLNPAGDPLVASGVRLARAMGAKVHLAHAHELPRVPGSLLTFGEVTVGELLDREWQALRERMDRQIERLGLRPEEIAGTTLDVGTPYRVLVAAARQNDVDLIVVGAAESAEAASRLIGSTADRVVRKADRPVLLVREELAVPPARVLLPTGLSGGTGEVLEESLALLDRMEGGREAELEALFIAAEVEGRPARGQSVPEPARDLAARRLDQFLAEAGRATQWQIGSRVEFGLIDREILKRIESWRPDWVVLRTHDRAEVEPFLLGRVTMALMRQGSASVLVVPPVAARAAMVLPQMAAVSVAA